MSRWLTVAICGDCWHARNGERTPARVKEKERESCHYCGTLTRSGIYVREDVETVPAAVA
jgi:hypothetical protein